jgi:hypothetical protein
VTSVDRSVASSRRRVDSVNANGVVPQHLTHVRSRCSFLTQNGLQHTCPLYVVARVDLHAIVVEEPVSLVAEARVPEGIYRRVHVWSDAISTGHAKKAFVSELRGGTWLCIPSQLIPPRTLSSHHTSSHHTSSHHTSSLHTSSHPTRARLITPHLHPTPAHRVIASPPDVSLYLGGGTLHQRHMGHG